MVPRSCCQLSDIELEPRHHSISAGSLSTPHPQRPAASAVAEPAEPTGCPQNPPNLIWKGFHLGDTRGAQDRIAGQPSPFPIAHGATDRPNSAQKVMICQSSASVVSGRKLGLPRSGKRPHRRGHRTNQPGRPSRPLFDELSGAGSHAGWLVSCKYPRTRTTLLRVLPSSRPRGRGRPLLVRTALTTPSGRQP